eukprot:768412-Hanusia_phi.AAC.1
MLEEDATCAEERRGVWGLTSNPPDPPGEKPLGELFEALQDATGRQGGEEGGREGGGGGGGGD